MATSDLVYWPTLNPRVTEEAGTRGGTHTGIDLAANVGDHVLAPFDGVAVFVGGDGARGSINGVRANGEGLTVDIRRADGLIARLGHLSGFNVQQGQTVTAGQVIAYAGNTGFSTGPHVHWELRWDRAWVGGRWINPRTVNPRTFTAVSAATLTASASIVRRRRKGKHMFIYLVQGKTTTYAVFELGVKGSWFQFEGQKNANELASQRGNAMQVDLASWKNLQGRHS